MMNYCFGIEKTNNQAQKLSYESPQRLAFMKRRLQRLGTDTKLV